MSGIKGKTGIYTRTEEHKKKLREIAKKTGKIGKPFFVAFGKDNPFYGKKHTEETKRKISEASKNRRHTEATRQRMSEIHKRIGAEWMKGKFGDKNPNWRGGITKLEELIRKHKKYKQWHSDIFERDNWTCQTCGKRGSGELHAHHTPKSFNQILKENQIKTIEQALKCEELWNINNGITLCGDCHKLTDNYSKRWLPL